MMNLHAYSLRSPHGSTTLRLIAQGRVIRADRQTLLGNPYPITAAHDRAHVIALHRTDVLDGLYDALLCQLLTRDFDGFACWCHPLPCHVDNYIDRLNYLRAQTVGGTAPHTPVSDLPSPTDPSTRIGA